MSRQRKSNIWFLSILIIVLMFLVFFIPSYGWKVREFLNSSVVSNTNDHNLAAENDVLKADLAKLQVVASQLPVVQANDIRAMVYSRYPLNFKNELLVDAGSNAGVVMGAPVVFQGALIGQVKNVFPDSATVQTVFDNGVKMPVRIGSGGYDGLLQGGSYPTVGSITKNVPLSKGDIVYAAASGLPYGLPIGEVDATSTSADSLFQQAILGFTYDVNAIQTVFIVK